MKRTIVLLAALSLAAVPLTSCTTYPASPGAVAAHTTLDEKSAIGAELAYTAASKAAALAIRTGVVKDRATITRIGQLDRQAYAAVVATRAAYNAGNAASYTAAFHEAESAVTALLTSF